MELFLAMGAMRHLEDGKTGSRISSRTTAEASDYDLRDAGVARLNVVNGLYVSVISHLSLRLNFSCFRYFISTHRDFDLR